ncbi:MAG: hypothetical protein J2P57_21795 [Acidimicrobiaceae bacterium]|nr:hypothetical protein [Acidimicrobiaceae bacterium]
MTEPIRGDQELGHQVDGDMRTDQWLRLATAEDDPAWLARTRVTLTPMAAPSIMGLFGFMIATLMVGAWQAGWYGNAATPQILWPLAIFAGGIFQLIAAIACFRARDGVALAVHTTWGAFWLGWGILQALISLHVMAPIPLGAASQSFAFWFIGISAVTISATLASTAISPMLVLTLGTLAAGAALTAAGFYGGSLGVTRAGGWLFVISAAAAWLFGTAMMLEHSFGRTIIPLGRYHKGANIPGGIATRPIQRPRGMPGVRVGQ